MKAAARTLKRSILFFVLVSTMLNLRVIPLSFGQGTQLKVVAPTTSIQVTAQFNIDITVVDVTDLWGWQIKLYYNPTVLRWINATYPPGHIFDGRTFVSVNPANDSDADGVYILFFASLQGNATGFTGIGTLCRIRFEAKAVGTSSLIFSRPLGGDGDTWLWNSSQTNYDISFTVAEASVTILSGAYEPTVSITFPPSGSEVRSATVTAEWTGTGGASDIDHYEIRLDGGEWTNVGTSTAYSFTGLGDGSHTIEVVATNKVGVTKQSFVSFTVNTSPLLGPGYIEEIIVLAVAIIAIVGTALYFLKLRKH